jgi:hypothetical protein
MQQLTQQQQHTWLLSKLQKLPAMRLLLLLVL